MSWIVNKLVKKSNKNRFEYKHFSSNSPNNRPSELYNPHSSIHVSASHTKTFNVSLQGFVSFRRAKILSLFRWTFLFYLLLSVFLDYECLEKTSDQSKYTVTLTEFMAVCMWFCFQSMRDQKQLLLTWNRRSIPCVLVFVRMQFTIQCKYALHAQCCHRGCYGRRWYFYKNSSS